MIREKDLQNATKKNEGGQDRMRKHLKKMLSMLMVVSMLMSTLATVSYANETTPTGPVSGVVDSVEDAILYTVDAEGNLEYNVVYEAALIAEPVVTDSTGKGIDSLAKLKEVMGEADKPALEFAPIPVSVLWATL